MSYRFVLGHFGRWFGIRFLENCEYLSVLVVMWRRIRYNMDEWLYGKCMAELGENKWQRKR